MMLTSVTGQTRWIVAEVVGRLERRLADDRGFEDLLGLVLGIGIEAEDLAEVRPARPPQFEPVGLGAAVGLFVRVDVPLAELLQPHAAHEAAAGVRLPRAR